MHGFMGKILVIDLTLKTWDVITKDEKFYRKYSGGSFLAAKLFQDQLKSGKITGPFDPENPIIFATGLFAGENVCGATRVNIFSLSPETTRASFVPSIPLTFFSSEENRMSTPSLRRTFVSTFVASGSSRGRSRSPLWSKAT